MSSGFQELRFWSISLGGPASRLSMVDDKGQEFFVVMARDEGKVWRERKHAALDIIEDAILRGHMPGEVHVTEGMLRQRTAV